MASPQKSARTMSSRLLTMKFMQRGVASSAMPSPDSADTRASKRQRLSRNTNPENTSSDFKAVQAAVAAEELRRSQALDRQASEAGDTKWILNFESEQRSIKPATLNVVHAGYNSIDRNQTIARTDEPETGEDSNFERTAGLAGRKIFGNFKKDIENNEQVENDKDASGAQSDGGTQNRQPGSGSDTGVSDYGSNGDQRGGGGRVERKKRVHDHHKQDEQQAAERRKIKKVKLQKLTSISGGPSNSPLSQSKGACYNCGSLSHRKKDCPAVGSSMDRHQRAK